MGEKGFIFPAPALGVYRTRVTTSADPLYQAFGATCLRKYPGKPVVCAFDELSADEPDHQGHDDGGSRRVYGRAYSPTRTTGRAETAVDRKSTRLNSSHRCISYAV